MSGIIARGLAAAKRVVFEKGHLIYWLNIPSYRIRRRKVTQRLRNKFNGAAGKTARVRLGFLVQDLTAWAVIEPVYLAARADPETEPVVLLVPEVEFTAYVKLKAVHCETVYAFGEQHFGQDAVRTWNPETESWLDPAALQLDAVFLPRPYETYLPKMYRASELHRLCRVCYVPYAPPLTDLTRLLYNMHFIRNVDLICCEKPSSYTYVTGRLQPTLRTGDQKAPLTGYPKYDLIPGLEGAESAAWPRPRHPGGQRLIWTPRWTMDPQLVASSFLQYYEELLEFAKRNHQIDVVIRPHPLMLKTFVSEGWIGQKELDDWLARVEQMDNVALDQASEYFDTFWSSDVLISDLSSVIMDYMLTGRPVLYCPTASGKTMSDDPRYAIRDLLPGFYVVHDFDEMQSVLTALARGQDPKREIRIQLAAELKRDGRIGQHILELVKAECRN